MSKPRLNFFNEDIVFRLANKRILKQWLIDVIDSEGFTPGDINIIFCNDAFQLNLNITYLKHKTLTDVITFDYSETKGSKKVLSGDIYISIERVRENAKTFLVSLADEVHRVMVHGILHLAGYSDKSAPLRKQMRGKEDFYLQSLKIK